MKKILPFVFVFLLGVMIIMVIGVPQETARQKFNRLERDVFELLAVRQKAIDDFIQAGLSATYTTNISVDETTQVSFIDTTFTLPFATGQRQLMREIVVNANTEIAMILAEQNIIANNDSTLFNLLNP